MEPQSFSTYHLSPLSAPGARDTQVGKDVVTACMELIVQRRHPVTASQSLKSMGQKGGTSARWRGREGGTRGSGLIEALHQSTAAQHPWDLLQIETLLVGLGRAVPRSLLYARGW